jgi:hypothetical protein
VLSNAQAPANLSYDARIRDTPMETSIAAGIHAFQEAIKLLEDVSKCVSEDFPVVLTADTGPHHQTLKTTFGREVCPLFFDLFRIQHLHFFKCSYGSLHCTVFIIGVWCG